MRRIVVWQYGLMAVAWVVAIIAWPLRGADLNGFVSWHSDVNTAGLVQFLFERPRSIAQDLRDPAMMSVRPSAVHSAWLVTVLIGFVFFAFAPTLVRRRHLWRAPGQTAIRGFAATLLAFPLATVAPQSWHLPQPMIGMYLLAAAHVLMFVALVMTPAKPTEGALLPGFPVQGGPGGEG